jgi:hypothetical protein
MRVTSKMHGNGTGPAPPLGGSEPRCPAGAHHDSLPRGTGAITSILFPVMEIKLPLKLGKND